MCVTYPEHRPCRACGSTSCPMLAGDVTLHEHNRLPCPYCNHDPLDHEIRDDHRVRCQSCLSGYCPG